MSQNPKPYQLTTRWRITGTFTTRSPMHIGSGETTHHDLLVDDKTKERNDVAAIVRDHQGNPIIPASALKGVLRSWAEEHYSNNPSIERIFGTRDSGATTAKAGFAEFQHAVFVPPDQTNLENYQSYLPYWKDERFTGILSHNCMDRQNGTVIEKKLFFEEFLPEKIQFRVVIEAERLEPGDIQLLLAVLAHGSTPASAPSHGSDWYQFGANGADGWGRVSWETTSVEKSEPTGMTFNSATLTFERTWVQVQDVTPLPRPTTTSSVRTIPVTLKCQGAFLVNDDSRTHREEGDGLPHFFPHRRADAGVWLPASSFRGVLRQRAEFILRSLDPNATGDPNAPEDKNGMIEKLFGHTGQRSRLTIEEFVGSKYQVGDLTRQDFVAIDRFTGGAAETAKFDARYAGKPTVSTHLHLDIRGLEPPELAVFAAALRDVMRGDLCFGFGGSKGYGEFIGKWDAESEKWAKEQLQHLPKPSVPQVVAQTSTTIPKAIEGKLIYQTIKGKPVRRIIFRNKKGEWTTNAPTPFDENILPTALRSDTRPEIEIDFDWASPNKPHNIRYRGEIVPVVAKHTFTVQQSAGKFAHAYYFLHQEERKTDWPHDFADREPIGHERYHERYYSGTIRVKLRTATPLLICNDAGRREAKTAGHFVYDMLVDADRRPILEPSRVRGMLRSAFEAITNSRFGVFLGHEDRLGLRMASQEGLGLVPCRIENGQILLMLGRSTIGATRPNGAMYAAWLPRTMTLASAGDTPAHRQRVCCWVELFERTPFDKERWAYDTSKRFTYWKVVAADTHGSTIPQPKPQSPRPLPAPPPRPSQNQKPPYVPSHHTSVGDPLKFVADGFVARTEWNFDKKYNERVFFTDTSSIPPIPLSEPLMAAWGNLIRNYRLNEDLKKGKPRPSALKSAGWSRHMTDDQELQLTEGSLAYARVVQSQGRWNVIELYPVMIARKLYSLSPRDVVKSLRPAEHRSELSPADRVFGWVSQNPDTKNNPAYRGQLRIGHVTCQTDNAVQPASITLPILAQPKPAQGRFYLGDKDGKTQQKGGSKEDHGYKGVNRIRGPKAYPHHNRFSIDPIRQRNETPSNQNRSITGYIKEDTEFAFTLHLLNVSRTELAALVWLLTLPEKHYHRLGLAKPLGFGSVELSIQKEGTCVAEGSSWTAKLNEWDIRPDSLDLSPLRAEYESIFSSVNPDILAAFLQITQGFGEVDVKYPPNPQNPDATGEHFEWFSKNERQPNQAVCLPDPNDSNPLLPTYAANG